MVIFCRGTLKMKKSMTTFLKWVHYNTLARLTGCEWHDVDRSDGWGPAFGSTVVPSVRDDGFCGRKTIWYSWLESRRWPSARRRLLMGNSKIICINIINLFLNNHYYSPTILSFKNRKTRFMLISSIMSQNRSTTSWMVFSHKPFKPNRTV